MLVDQTFNNFPGTNTLNIVIGTLQTPTKETIQEWRQVGYRDPILRTSMKRGPVNKQKTYPLVGRQYGCGEENNKVSLS